MAVLEIVKYGHPALRKVAQPVDVEEIDQNFIDDMIETMQDEDGVGLAASQVNISKRIIIASDLENTLVIINPEIIAFSENTITETEGCLSLPGLQAIVERAEKVIVKGLDRYGQSIEINGKGLLSRVLQHEIDHLNGILYIDKANPETLVWLKYGDDGEDVEKVNTAIKDVREEFRQQFNKDKKELVF